MLLLAIDTGGVDCAAGLYDLAGGRMLAEKTETIGKGHAESLMAFIDDVLEQAKASMDDIARVAVTIGPGSFTGIRVGVAAARGFALALSCPVIGVTTLEVLAASETARQNPNPVMAAMDGRRSDVYVQVFAPSGLPVTEAMVMTPADAQALALEHQADIIGSGKAVILGQAGKDADHFPMGLICAIAARKPDNQAPPRPLYLRGADAKPQTGFALERA